MTHLALLQKWHRDGDAEAFNEVARAYAGLVFGVCRRILGNPADAQDAAQQCFIALARARNLPTRDLASWLHVVATNEARKFLRGERRRQLREQRYALQQRADEEPHWDEISPGIDEAIAALPEEWRVPVVAYFLNGESQNAIAERLGVTRQTVARRLRSGVESIRATLKSRGIIVSAVTLVNSLTQNAAEAAPPMVVAGIGKLAISGLYAPSRAGALALTKTTLGSASIAASSIAILVAAALYASLPEHEPAPKSSPALAADRNADTAPHFASSPHTQQPAARRTPLRPLAVKFDSGPVRAQKGAPGGSVSGTVVLPDGTPYAGANVSLAPAGASISEVIRNKGWPELSVEADEAGCFSIYGLAEDEYHVCVSSPEIPGSGTAYRLKRVRVGPNEAITGLRLVYGLEGELSIRGRVVDSRRDPVESAQVQITGHVARGAVTDSDGNFAIDYLPEGKHPVSTSKPGFNNAYVTADAGTSALEIVMQRYAIVEGRVIREDTGDPVASFEAGVHRGFPKAEYLQYAGARAFQDPDGRFRLEYVPIGEARIFARAPGLTPAMLVVNTTEGERITGLELRLTPGRHVIGRVVDSNGLGIAGARVEPGGTMPAELLPQLAAAITGADGAFEIPGIPETVHIVSAYHPGFAPGSTVVSDDTIVTLERPASVRVHVRIGGQPHPDCYVQPSVMPGSYQLHTSGQLTGLDGCAVLDQLSPGRAAIEARVDNHRSIVKEIDLGPSEQGTLEFDFAESVSELKGSVLVEGQPAAQGNVFVRIATNQGIEELRTDVMAGVYHFRGVPAGVATLKADASLEGETFGGRSARIEDITIEPGYVVEQDVIISGVSSIDVSVDPSDGRYLSAYVFAGNMPLGAIPSPYMLTGIDDMAVSRERISEDGTCHVDALQPGDYTVVLMEFVAGNTPAESRIYPRASRPVHLSPDQSAPVSFDHP